MKVSVVCFGPMREFLPDDADDNRCSVEVSDGATLGEVVDGLGAPRRLVVAALLNGMRSDLGEKVDDGDEVTLMPAFTGG